MTPEELMENDFPQTKERDIEKEWDELEARLLTAMQNSRR